MNLCSILISMIIGFVILHKNMTVINVVPAGTDIKSIVLMLLIMLFTVFVLQFIPAQNSVLFSSHGISGFRFSRFSLNLPANLAYESMKINNSIKLNYLVIILQLFSCCQSSDRLAQR